MEIKIEPRFGTDGHAGAHGDGRRRVRDRVRTRPGHVHTCQRPFPPRRQGACFPMNAATNQRLTQVPIGEKIFVTKNGFAHAHSVWQGQRALNPAFRKSRQRNRDNGDCTEKPQDKACTSCCLSQEDAPDSTGLIPDYRHRLLRRRARGVGAVFGACAGGQRHGFRDRPAFGPDTQGDDA